MKFALLTLAARGFTAGAIAVGSAGASNQSGCLAEDRSQRVELRARLATFGVECEEMCKKLGTFPNCQCPGFEGNVASDGDERLCFDKYCQDPETPCPTDNFVTCVKENTGVSALQWPALLQRLDASLRLTQNVSVLKNGPSFVQGKPCAAADVYHRSLIQAKLAVFGVECEEMCKKIGTYPKCQCPGFEGNVASDGDERMCFDKYCQDPKLPCPHDNFVSCVKENTKVSALQWQALARRFDASVKSWAAAKAATMQH